MSSGLYSGQPGLSLGTGLYRTVSGLWSGASGLTMAFGGAGMTLSLDFTTQTYSANFNSYAFQSLIDFTRTSAATYVDATGKIVSTPASRNLLTFTQEFDNAAWSKSNSTITANSTAAPDGTMTADTLVEDAATATHLMSQTQTLSATPYTASVYLKAKERGFALFSQGTVNGISVNLSTGAVASAVGSPTNIASTNAGNGWWRVSFTFTPSAGSTSLNVYASTDGVWANRSYAGSTSSGIFVWGTQLELGSTLTTYTRNNGGVYPPRFDYDPVTLAPRGLLVEEQRTNLLLRSEEFDNASWTKSRSTITANATTSPDGTVDADKLVEDTTATQSHIVSQAVTISTAANYTASVYIKAAERTFARLLFGDTGGNNSVRVDVNLSTGATSTGTSGTGWTLIGGSATAVGNGWYRVTVSGTSAASTSGVIIVYMMTAMNTITYTGDGTSGIYVWGAQLEAGAFATSYIPTVASQVTRTADVATITGANFSQWYNQSEGTFVVDARSDSDLVNAQTMVVSDGTNNERIMPFYFNGSGQRASFVADGNITQANLTYGASAANTTYKAAFSYRVNDFAGSVNGEAIQVDALGTLPTVDRLWIGSLNGSALTEWNGWIRSIRYYNTRLPNAQLQALTS